MLPILWVCTDLSSKMDETNPAEPDGALVSTSPALKPAPTILRSSLPSTHVQSVTLVPLSESHADALYPRLSGPEAAHLYRYTPVGPFYNFESFKDEQIRFLVQSEMCVSFAIIKNSGFRSAPSRSTDGEGVTGSPVGIVCLLSIDPSNRTIEIGAVLFSPLLQRTTAATEAIYLLMKHSFEGLGYRRVAWKANNFNEPSKRAAVRLGFVPEGVFRNHMIVKGRSRDSAWFSVTDDEWVGGVKAALEGWLEKGNFDEDGKQMTKLEDIRARFTQENAEAP